MYVHNNSWHIYIFIYLIYMCISSIYIHYLSRKIILKIKKILLKNIRAQNFMCSVQYLYIESLDSTFFWIWRGNPELGQREGSSSRTTQARLHQLCAAVTDVAYITSTSHHGTQCISSLLLSTRTWWNLWILQETSANITALSTAMHLSFLEWSVIVHSNRIQ